MTDKSRMDHLQDVISRNKPKHEDEKMIDLFIYTYVEHLIPR